LAAIRTSPAAVGRDADRALVGFAALRGAIWVATSSSGVGWPARRCMVLIADRRRPSAPRLSPGALSTK
jgi:hypothetical protein